MKPSRVRGGRSRTFEFTCDPKELSSHPPIQSEVEIRCPGGEWLLCIGERAPIGLRQARGREREFEDLRASTLPRICWLASVSKALDRVVVQVVEFLGSLPLETPLDFGADEAIVADLHKHGLTTGSVDEAIAWLTERFLLIEREPRRAIVIPASRGELLGAFRILGDGFSVEIRQKQQRFVCHRIVRQVPAGVEGHILRGSMRFCDATAAGAVRDAIRNTLEKAIQDKESYLGIWTTYRKIESETLLRKAQDFGVVQYLRWERVREDGNAGWRFLLAREDDLADRFQDALEDEATNLEASEKAPDLYTAAATASSGNGPAKRPFLGRIMKFDPRGPSVLLAPNREEDERTVAQPPDHGFLYICQQGDRKRLQRQQQAEERIRMGTCPMPWLALLFDGRPAPSPSHRKVEGMSQASREAFGGTPTPAQQDALTIALNTPDIALIQGPPGTGKTKVITALQRRIAELAKENEEVAHRILVTSAQHEAVENVVLRSKVYGLAPYKVGKARNAREDGIDPVEVFRQGLVEAVQSRLGTLPAHERAARVRRAVVTALRTTCRRSALADCIAEILKDVEDLLLTGTVDRLRSRAKWLRTGHAAGTADDHEEQQLRLDAARSVRVLPASFSDDGPLRARVALRRLDGILTPEERRLLLACAEHPGTPTEADFAALATARDRLVDCLTPKPALEPLGCDEETTQLLLQVIDELQQRRVNARGSAAAVVTDWLHDLMYDPDAARDVLRHYTAVLAATLQHAASHRMAEVRGSLTGQKPFDTVIVDEAARAHPLDLLIPMSLAGRRIVLVGDHRQLPHMLEPDIERQLAERAQSGDSLPAATEQRMRQSLFEHLWQQLKKLEAEDGIRRTATLDMQFRMHPVLGEFVSKNFYEAEGDRRIESPLPATQFAHSLSAYQAPGGPAIAAWLDVPSEEGQEERGRSKFRPAEAERIAQAVKEVLDQDPSLSVGVIAFYRRQVDVIYESMERLGLTHYQDSSWQVDPAYRQTTNRNGQTLERLRIGTVDAFQGREFDVVFLSMTRSNRLPHSDRLEDLRRKYGHLMLKNRMCVGMSRQHRLLVCVGDLAFAEAAKPLKHLRAFAELCRGAHGVVR